MLGNQYTGVECKKQKEAKINCDMKTTPGVEEGARRKEEEKNRTAKFARNGWM